VQNRRYKDDLEKTRKEFRRLEAEFLTQKSKETLMGTRLESGPGTNGTEKLLSGADMIMEQNLKIQEGLQIGLEAEEVAQDTMKQLGQNRDTIKRAQNGINKVDQNISKGNTILNSITRRAIQNKVIMIIVVLLLLLAIGLVIYFKMMN
jgi:vesicle transport through interaction with t-SNAREs protein 1